MQQQEERTLALREAVKADPTSAYIRVLPGLGDFRNREIKTSPQTRKPLCKRRVAQRSSAQRHLILRHPAAHDVAQLARANQIESEANRQRARQHLDSLASADPKRDSVEQARSDGPALSAKMHVVVHPYDQLRAEPDRVCHA